MFSLQLFSIKKKYNQINPLGEICVFLFFPEIPDKPSLFCLYQEYFFPRVS